MAHARAADHGTASSGSGGAPSAPPTDPLDLVRSAVGGADLIAVTRRTAEGCGRAVAIALPSFGEPVHWPASAHPERLQGLSEYASALVALTPASLPDGVAEAAPITVGTGVVGVVAALGPGSADIALRPWLDAAAAAAAVTTLLRDASALDVAGARRSFLEGLELHPPADIDSLLTHARRLGADLNHGAIGLCALGLTDLPASVESSTSSILWAEVGTERCLGLLPLAGDGAEAAALALVATLREAGVAAACSAPRRAPELLQEALLEAALLAELRLDANPADCSGVQEETYRLLIGVLLRSTDELSRLRAGTVAELERYDALHDTELLATLQAFLAHHGSTTETAEAMSLHRHTVGYRLARVQEVAGLSPYESDGRERLSLGLKADRILMAERSRLTRARPS